MDPTSPQPFVGATDLWRQLQNESSDTACSYQWIKRHGMHSQHYRPTSNGNCHQPTFFQGIRGLQGPNFGPGFIVNYSQQVPGRLGYHGRYLVKPGLSPLMKKRIALTIMLEVSYGFENVQWFFDRLGLASNSGYAADDLTANVIGLLIAMGEVTLEQALATCHEVSKQDALHIWDTQPRGLHRDYANPILHCDTRVPVGTNMDGSLMMRDACQGQPRRVPEFLTRIQPIAPHNANSYYTGVESGYGLPR